MRSPTKTIHPSTLAPAEGQEYPPLPAIPETPSPECSLHPIFRLSRVFAVRRRRAALHKPTASDNQARQTTEFGATTPTTTSSQTSASNNDVSESAKTHEKSAPPIVIPSVRWTATPQTFTVRREPEFTVTCTVVHPIARCRLGWPNFLKFNFHMPCPRSRSGKQKPVSGRSPKKAKRKSRGGVAVELDVFDDAPSVTQRKQQTQQEKRIKAARRNSGWAGVFSDDAHHASSSASTSGDENRTSFAIDRASDRLVVPDVDIGVAYSVKEELEEAVLVSGSAETSGFSSFGGDSEESWLELE